MSNWKKRSALNLDVLVLNNWAMTLIADGGLFERLRTSTATAFLTCFDRMMLPGM